MTVNTNVPASDLVGLVGVIDPDAYPAGAVSTGWFSLADFHAFMAVVKAGDLGASATLDAKLEQATDASGSGAKDITGKAITQLTQAGGDSNKQAVINLRPEEADVEGVYTHARLTLTVAVATSDAVAAVFGIGPRYGPATKRDLASVAEVVA